MTCVTVYGHTARQIQSTLYLIPKQAVTIPVSITYCTVEGRDKVTFKLPEEATE